ncbi:hypothetical protein BGZ94_001280, partial [Podila epigama]
VGQCLPLWKQNQNLGFYDYNPSFLLSCTLVNKTWRDALLPVIWYVYKGDTMRLIPKPILVKNSHHFCIFIHDHSFSGPFHCTHLKELTICWWDDQLLPLVQANTDTLQSLFWKGSSSQTRARSSQYLPLDYDLLARMAPSLRSLQLSHWTLSGKRFLHFLSQCKQLTELSLATIDWTDPSPVTSPLAVDSQGPFFATHPCLRHSQSHPLYRQASSPPTPHQFHEHSYPNYHPLYQQHHQYHHPYHFPYHDHDRSWSDFTLGLKDLRLDISHSKEDAFVDLIQACPKLEYFTLLSESSIDVKTFIPVLARSCPLLKSIDYTSRFNSALAARDYLSDVEYSDFVLCSPRLAHLKMDIPFLGESLTRAILAQSPYLESLQLRFYEDRVHGSAMIDAIHLTRILENCPNLKTLALVFSSAQSLGMDETGQLLKGTWACTALETLVLSGVTVVRENHHYRHHRTHHGPTGRSLFPWQVNGTTGGLVDVGGAHTPLTSTELSTHHGQEQQHGHSEREDPMLTKRRLFEQVRRLPMLTKLCLNSVTFSLDGITALA